MFGLFHHFFSFLRFSLLFALVPISGGLTPLAASQLRLSNGDQLTGTVIGRSEGKLHFRSQLLGDLVIDESAAKLVEEGEGEAEAPAIVEASAAEAEAVVASVESTDTEASPVATGGVTAPPRVTWSGQVELSLFNQTGRSTNKNSSLRLEASRVSRRNNYRLRSRYIYGKNAVQVSNDRLNADLRWRRELSPRVFAQSQTSYLRDRLAAISFSAEQNLSLGYQVLKRSRYELNVGGGATGLYRDASAPSASSLYLAEGFQDYSYKLNSRFTITEGLNLLYSPDGRVVGNSADNDHYKVRFNSAIQGKMTDKISLSLRFEYEYDNSITVKEARTDQRITSSVGYTF